MPASVAALLSEAMRFGEGITANGRPLPTAQAKWRAGHWVRSESNDGRVCSGHIASVSIAARSETTRNRPRRSGRFALPLSALLASERG